MTGAPIRTGWLDVRPSPKPGLVVQPVDGEVVIYDPEADALHHLEPTASTVWALLNGERSVRSVAADVADIYHVPEAAIRSDVHELIDVLHHRGLLAGSVGVRTSTGRRPVYIPPDKSDLGGQQLPAVPYLTRAFRGLEYSFAVATNQPGVRDYLDEILADLSDDDCGDPIRYELIALAEDQYAVRCEDDLVVETGRLDRALSVLLWHINAEVVRRTSTRHLAVHAAAATRNGMTVLLPAAPESGKTTTVAGLVANAGFGYLTDEAVAIDTATLIPWPYAKPLSVNRGSWDVLAHLRPSHHSVVTGQWQVPASAIRPDAVASAAPIRFVVEPAYDRSADTRLEQISMAAMLVRLADSTFSFHESPQRNLAVLARVLEQAECYRLLISDLDDGVELIARLVTRESRA